MTVKKQVLAIINPISGGKKKQHLPYLLQQFINHTTIDLTIAFSKDGTHLKELAQTAVNKHFDAVIAAGGDGTINAIATQLVNTPVCMGIIPLGSGNGFANALKIPKQIKSSVAVINKFSSRKIDCGTINNKLFVNVAGTGFDASIGYAFNKFKKRGLITYVKLVISQIFNFKSKPLTVVCNQQTHIFEKVFLATVGNGMQYGNNVYITPEAMLNDGLLNLIVIEKLNLVRALKLMYAVFTKKFGICNSFCHHFVAADFILIRNQQEAANIDGESEILEEALQIKVLPDSLNVLIP
jgi:YegS/Rv2252/BmrU family lipid kinase